MGRSERRAWLSWVFVGALVVLTAALAILQYRWIGEVSQAESLRLRASLNASLNGLGRDFNNELSSICGGLVPPDTPPDEATREQVLAAQFAAWRQSGRHAQIVRNVFVAVPKPGSIDLLAFHPDTGALEPVSWPQTWIPLRERFAARISGDERRMPGPITEDLDAVIELPYFEHPEAPPHRGGWREADWILVDLNLDYVRTVWIPELLRKHLGGGNSSPLDYDSQVVARRDPSDVIFRSTPETSLRESNADAVAGLFDVRFERFARRSFGGRRFPGPWAAMSGRPGPPPPDLDRGKWRILVRHRSGSLEALVAQTRTRNLAVTGAIFVLMLVAAAALVHFSRRAQKLAELEMEFVAGVSHELRTPLSVMRTAGHNLQGKVAADPVRVRRYGALIQEESEKLTEIVEQILRFANTKAGRVIDAKDAVNVEELIDEAICAEQKLFDECNVVVEREIPATLPAVFGDRTTLLHALKNILSNAAKYGRSGAWIGVKAAMSEDGQAVEVRIADRGPGIAAADLGQIFDPFFRGKRAIQDQIHGTGLGLSLAKKIIDAHGGDISVRSKEGHGTEFVIRIPVASTQKENELANLTH